MALQIYNTPQSFLDASETFLAQKEMENNVLLGNCYNSILEKRDLEGCYFMNTKAANSILACSVKLSPKVIISGNDEVSIKEIFQFYKTNNVEFKGVIGNRFSSDLFAKLSSKKILQSRVTLIQSLDKTKEVSLTEGAFELSTLAELDLLSDWAFNFFEEENLFPKRARKQIKSFIKKF